ncbi:MAG: molybdopterin molybdotransferase MoeA [Planctomycetes bacterium]|nr:molybdopterin molybdotransferase MoeA [Planctomycetota bacterium]
MPGLPTVDEALAAVLARVERCSATCVATFHEAVGSVLAEEIRADHDHPPFRRSKVDGYAVRSADVSTGSTTLRIACRIAAGTPPGDCIRPGEAARIFTGAAVPDGADAVAMQERCAAAAADDDDGSSVRVEAGAASADNLVPQGAECHRGAVVASPGDVVTPGLVGALNSAGAWRGLVLAPPRVSIVATGSELVPATDVPGPGQIRNSNAPSIFAAVRACGGAVIREATVGDDAEAMREALRNGLDGDLLVVTGGVSVGDFDLVPQLLEELGVTKVLHGVKLQPGKPLWFGVKGGTLVFGLPGNPVSALVNMALFVRPAMAKRMGRAAPRNFRGTLGAPVGKGTWRRKYVPASARDLSGGLDAAPVVTPVAFQGSGDLFGFSRANCLVVVPEDSAPRMAGDPVECVPLFEVMR